MKKILLEISEDPETNSAGCQDLPYWNLCHQLLWKGLQLDTEFSSPIVE